MSGHYQLLPTSGSSRSSEENTPPRFYRPSLADNLFAYFFRRSPALPASPTYFKPALPSTKLRTCARATAGFVVTAAVAGGITSWIFHDDIQEWHWQQYTAPAPPEWCFRDPASPRNYMSIQPINDTEVDELLYRCVTTKPPSSPPPLRSYQALPPSCLDAYMANGEPCPDLAPTTFDLAWTWVNGSDYMLHYSMQTAENSTKVPANVGSKGQKLYRDHDELRHSLRSALTHFRPYTDKFHLITSDFPSPPNSEPHNVRIGMVPQWLDRETRGAWKDGDVNLNIVHHAELYSHYYGTPYNSFSIESQLTGLPSRDTIIYLNDDFFFLKDLKPADFHTEQFGLVFRLLAWPYLLVTPQEVSTKPGDGEWQPLEYTQFLLSKRFGFRKRPYSSHVAKTASIPLMQEMTNVWPDAFNQTAQNRFRGLGGDIYMLFGFVHFVVERHREALLWSYIVGAVGGDDDEWGREQRRRSWAELGGAVDDSIGGVILVKVTKRETLNEDRVNRILSQNGDGLNGTRYQFSSQDGYPYSFFNETLGLSDVDQRAHWPLLFDEANFEEASFEEENFEEENFEEEDLEEEDLEEENFKKESRDWATCEIEYKTCFAGFNKASEVFANVAFENPKCGDCIIKALVSRSGELGLGAFLPSSERKYRARRGNHARSFFFWETEEEVPPHLPLTSDWRTTDFSLGSVLGSGDFGLTVNLRTFSERLLERYRFVIGDTHFSFAMIYNPRDATRHLSGIDKDPEMALCAINDNVNEKYEETDRAMREWLEQKWPEPAAWEQQVEVEVVEEVESESIRV